jgi:hypothetical protein
MQLCQQGFSKTQPITCRADMSLGSGLATIAVKLYPLLEHQSFQNTSLISYPSFWIGAIKLRKMDFRTSSYHLLLIWEIGVVWWWMMSWYWIFLRLGSVGWVICSTLLALPRTCHTRCRRRDRITDVSITRGKNQRDLDTGGALALLHDYLFLNIFSSPSVQSIDF